MGHGGTIMTPAESSDQNITPPYPQDKDNGHFIISINNSLSFVKSIKKKIIFYIIHGANRISSIFSPFLKEA